MAPISPQSIEYLAQLSTSVQKILPMFRSEVSEVLSDHQLSFDLYQASAGSGKEKMEFVR